ncbi:hypothetical protein [Acinetobacter bereziniae]|uniref:hypothetical protein n=5 Tax=Acinetobacter bereziniae TaxID=106648 RepID=UPI003AF465EF
MSSEGQLKYLQKNQNLFVYVYEWIDNLSYTRKCQVNVYGSSLNIINDKLIDAGWNGDGEISEIWIPPFVIGSILNEELEDGYNLINNWKCGYILWHVKQKSDGLSFIGSLKKLNIPDYAL